MKDIVNSRGAKVIRAKGFAFIPTLKGRVFPLRPSQSREIKLWRKALAGIHEPLYDLRVFELMPLYLKIEVIEKGVVVFARDVYELYEYFYTFRRIWGDQKHRQSVSLEEALIMLGGKAASTASK